MKMERILVGFPDRLFLQIEDERRRLFPIPSRGGLIRELVDEALRARERDRSRHRQIQHENLVAADG